MTLKPSDLIGSSGTQPQPVQQQASPKGCLMFLGYGLLFLFLAPMALGSGGMASEFVPAWLMWLTFLGVLSIPLLIQYKFKRKWKKRNLFATFFLTYAVVMGITQSFFTDTEAYRQYRARSAAREAQEKMAEQQAAEVAPQAPTAYQIGQPFKVGYTSYLVKGINWKQRLGSAYFGKSADSRYLLVDIQVKNEDRENRMIPPFKLIDETGATYDDSADAMYLGDKAVLLDNLNPGVSKVATLVFDVPPEHHYKLVVSGGFWSGEETYVTLN